MIKRLILFIGFTVYLTDGVCCVTCNKTLQDAILDRSFYPNLLSVCSSFIVLSVIMIILAIVVIRRLRTDNIDESDIAPLASAATVAGIGLGGFVDGILLHQVLQWHELLSARIAVDTLLGKSVNMFWDGIFHTFTLITCIAGVVFLWFVLRRDHVNTSGYLLSGGMLTGWAIFNVVEGVINHHLLKLHHVRETSAREDAWDQGFLVFSMLLFIIGYLLIKKGRYGRKMIADATGNLSRH